MLKRIGARDMLTHSRLSFDIADFVSLSAFQHLPHEIGTMSTSTEPRKSVSFSQEATMVDTNGDVTTEVNGDSDKTSAQSHTAGLPAFFSTLTYVYS